MKVLRLLAILIFASLVLPAQTPVTPAQPPATGAINGHVFLGDSHLPARMAWVTLLPTVPPPVNGFNMHNTDSQSKSAPTQLDGSFTIRNVIPGSYYVLAEKEGYVSPIRLPFGTISSLSKEEQDSLPTLLTTITVIANRATNVEITLPKGAAISGRVRFDDGLPDTEASVSVLHKDKSGKWVPYCPVLNYYMQTGGDGTDDRGDFRIPGLPAGEYLLSVSLEDWGSNYSIDIYYGDVTRLKDAKSIKVKDGEESSGNNIVIPLGKLHSVSGTVISAETGEKVMAEFVQLHDADDDSTVAGTSAIVGQGEFRFPYVPEGKYTLKASGLVMDLHRDGLKPAREYLDASQFLIVKGETNGVTIQVKPKPAAATATQ